MAAKTDAASSTPAQAGAAAPEVAKPAEAKTGAMSGLLSALVPVAIVLVATPGADLDRG